MPPKRKPTANRDASPQRPQSRQSVYIVCMGWDYGGDDNEGGFSNIEDARKCARHLVKRASRSEEWKEEDTDHWRYRSGHIEIQKEDVHSSFAEWIASRNSTQ